MTITRMSPDPTSFRAARVIGMFDIPPQARGEVSFPDNFGDLGGEDWHVGCVVGSSGSGKTTMSRHVFGEDFVESAGHWGDTCILDDFDESCSVDDIVGALIAVGLSTPPAWLRPYSVLSTGERFRADLARALVGRDACAYDEFTSVVDRNVARAASVAVSKYVRREGKHFVAVTCHRDVVDWLEPDWVYDTDVRELRWGRLRRPDIDVELHHGSKDLWALFGRHHYLSNKLAPAAKCYAIFVHFGDAAPDDFVLVGFFSHLPAMGMRGWVRGHRLVILPDFQGMGIGSIARDLCGEHLWSTQRKRLRIVASHPGTIGHFKHAPDAWRCVAAPGMKAKSKSGVPTSVGRLTSCWEYVPRALR